jgi:hypothetical protein
VETSERRQYDDEIDLRDLALTLIRRKWLILTIFALCCVIALGYGVSRPRTYAYVTVLEIGTVTTVEGEKELIQPVKTALQKLEDEIIPATVVAMQSEYPQASFSLNAKAGSGTGGILLQNTGSHDDEEMYLQAHGHVVQSLEEDLQSGLREWRDETALAVKEFQRELKLEAEKIEMLAARLEKNTASMEAMRNERTLFDEQIQVVVNRIKSFVEEYSTRNAGFRRALMEDLNRHEALKKELEYDIETAEDTQRRIQNEIAAAELEMEEDRRKLEEMQAELEAPVQVLQSDGPAVSQVSQGRGAKFHLALGAVLGLMLGVFAAFAAEFIAGLRRYQQEKEGRQC